MGRGCVVWAAWPNLIRYPLLHLPAIAVSATRNHVLSEVEFLGAYFPGWLIAAILGIILTGCSKVLFSRIGLHAHLVLPMLVYVCLAFLWTGLLWSLLFK